MSNRKFMSLAAIVVAFTPAAALAQEAGAVALPGGASSVTEVHGDWTVACRVSAGAKACSLTQMRLNPQTGQRVYGFELQPAANDGLVGAFVLPFGLRVSSPTHMKVDDVVIGGDWPFSTCNPQGCFVPASFDAAGVEALTAGAILAITATDNSSSNELTYELSLTGLTAALNRAVELTK